MAENTQTLFTPEETSAIQSAEADQLMKLVELETIEEQENQQLLKDADIFQKTGYMPKQEGPGFGEIVEGVGRGVIKSTEALLSGQETPLDYARDELAKLNIAPGFDPYKAWMQGVGAVKRIWGDYSIPEEDIVIENPREEAKKRLSRPLRDEQGLITDLDALDAANIPRPIKNEIYVKSMARQYNVPVDTLRELLQWRMGTTPDDGAFKVAAKRIGQVFDSFLARIPSMITSKTYRETHAAEFEKILTRPEGQEYFDQQTINTQIKPKIPDIRRGNITELVVNGMSIDVNANDTLDTIQNKAYKEELSTVLASVEMAGQETSADVLGMLVMPFFGTYRNIAKTLATTARMGKLTKTATKLENIAKAGNRVNPFERSATALVDLGPIRRLAPEFAAKLETNAIAQVGDYIVTQTVVQPGLAALGAPPGMEGDMALMSGIMAMPLTALGLPGAVVRSMEISKSLQLDAPLLKAMSRANDFKEMPRIFQNRLKKYAGNAAVDEFAKFKRAQALPSNFKALFEEVHPAAIEWRRQIAKQPEVRQFVDDLYKDIGMEYTIQGNQTLKVMTEIIDDNNSRASANIGNTDINSPQATFIRNQTKEFNGFLTKLMDIPGLMNNPQKLLDYLAKKKHPLTQHLQKYLQNIETDLAYERAVDNLIVTGGMLSEQSLAQTLAIYDGGVIARNDPILDRISKLIKIDNETTQKGRISIEPQQTLANMKNNPEAVLEFFEGVEDIRGRIQQTKDIEASHKKKTGEIQKKQILLKQELSTLNKEKRALEKQYEKIRADYGKGKRKMEAAMNTLDRSLPIGLASSPDLQVAKSMINRAIENDLPIDDAAIRMVEKVVLGSYESKPAIDSLMKEILVYNNLNKESTRFRNTYDRAVTDFMALENALDNSASDPKLRFAYVLRGLIGEEFKPEGMFHGTATPIEGFNPDYFNGLQLFGEGFYTTDSFTTAQIYKKKNLTKKDAESRRGTKVYKVIEREPVKFLNLNQKVSEDTKTILREVYEFNGEFADIIDDIIIDGTLFDALVEFQRNAPYYEYTAVVDELIRHLKQAGYGGFEHIGGLLVGKKEHNVKIYWEPWNQIDVVPYSEAKLKVLPSKTIDVYSAIQSFLHRENPQFAKILDANPEFSAAIDKAAEHISLGENVPNDVKQRIRTFTADRAEARRIVRALGEARYDSEKIQATLRDMKAISDIVDLAENTIIMGEHTFDTISADIVRRKEKIDEVAPLLRKLREDYNSVEFMKELKELDEKHVFPIFDKLAEGTTLSREERKLAYKYITGTIGEQLYLRNHPTFMVTSREKAESMFVALQTHGAGMLEQIRGQYEKTFDRSLNTPVFVSLFVNPRNGYNADQGIDRILQMAAARRDPGMIPPQLKQLFPNQEAALDWIQDRVGMDVETAAIELPMFQIDANRIARAAIDTFQKAIRSIKEYGVSYLSVQGKRAFGDIVKKVVGVEGLPEPVVTFNLKTQQAELTPYGELIKAWKVENHGMSLEAVMDAKFGKEWRKDPERKWMVDLSIQYWTDPKKATRADWAIAFEFQKKAKEFDYSRLQEVNAVIRKMNQRFGTTYPEYNFFPDRIAVGIDRSLRQKTFGNLDTLDMTAYDVLFGRHISTSVDGQINKLAGLGTKHVLHPELVVMNETYRLFEEAYTQHIKRTFERNITTLAELGYELEAGMLSAAYHKASSETTIVQTSPMRQIGNAFIAMPGTGHLMLLTRPLINMGFALAKPASVIKNLVQSAQTAGANAINSSNRWLALRMLFSPLNHITAATGFGGFITQRVEKPTTQFFLRLSPNARWPYVETGEGFVDGKLAKAYEKAQVILGLNSYHELKIVGTLLDRERNATGINKARTYEALPNFPGTGASKIALTAWSSMGDKFADLTVGLLKEGVELSIAREAYKAALHIYGQAAIVAKRTQDPGAVVETLIAPMAGLRNEAPYFRIAMELVEATKGEKVDYDRLNGRIAENYALMFRNFAIGRFDHHAAPPAIKTLIRYWPKGGQFFSAQFNDAYRLFTAARKSQLSYGHKAAIALYFTSTMSMVAAWEALRQQTGFDVQGWSTNSQVQALVQYAYEGELVEGIKNATISQDEMYGVELNIAKQALFEAGLAMANSREDDAESKAKAQYHLLKAADHLIKISPYALISDFVSSPAAFWSIFMADRLIEMETNARIASKEGPMKNEDREITLAVDLMNIIYGEGWKAQSTNPYWYERSDALMTLLSEHGMSRVLTYWQQLRRLDMERMPKPPDPDALPIDNEAIKDALIKLHMQGAGKNYNRTQRSVQPKEWEIDPTFSSEQP